MHEVAEFREYRAADLDAVIELCAKEGWRSYTAERDRTSRVLTAPGVVTVVATIKGDIVGFAYFQSDGAIQAHLSLLVVDEGHRREGIARALVTRAFADLHATRIDLITDSADAFYRALPHQEKTGFRLYADPQ